jgi:hypothetical protein
MPTFLQTAIRTASHNSLLHHFLISVHSYLHTDNRLGYHRSHCVCASVCLTYYLTVRDHVFALQMTHLLTSYTKTDFILLYFTDCTVLHCTSLLNTPLFQTRRTRPALPPSLLPSWSWRALISRVRSCASTSSSPLLSSLRPWTDTRMCGPCTDTRSCHSASGRKVRSPLAEEDLE